MRSVRPSTDAELAWPDDAIEVGRIVDAWGLKGWIKVQPFASDPQALHASRCWFIQPPEASGLQRLGVAASSYPNRLQVLEAKDHGEVVVARLADVDDRTAAESLRGARVFIGRSRFPSAGTDEYYWVDLIGLHVFNRTGESLGIVVGLLDTGPHSVLRVRSEGLSPQRAAAESAERLIPFVAAYVDAVSLPDKRITVDWGLDY